MWALIKSKQVDEVLEVAAIRHMETITTGMVMDMIAFNQAK
jgi:hypothetical protein